MLLRDMVTQNNFILNIYVPLFFNTFYVFRQMLYYSFNYVLIENEGDFFSFSLTFRKPVNSSKSDLALFNESCTKIKPL